MTHGIKDSVHGPKLAFQMYNSGMHINVMARQKSYLCAKSGQKDQPSPPVVTAHVKQVGQVFVWQIKDHDAHLQDGDGSLIWTSCLT